jgi:phospholipid transport system substrate-binding protein
MLRRLVYTLVILIGAGGALPHGAAAAAADPGQFITQLGNKTLDILNQKQMPPAEREKRFRDLWHEGFDIEGISRFVLGPYWRSANDQQRQEFLKLFEDYVVKIYSQRFNEYSGEKFKITGSRPEGEGAAVTSVIERPNNTPPVKVDWRLVKKSEAWKISDVIVEGVSMAVTQRQEFASVIQRGGNQLEALLQTLREKTRS